MKLTLSLIALTIASMLMHGCSGRQSPQESGETPLPALLQDAPETGDIKALERWSVMRNLTNEDAYFIGNFGGVDARLTEEADLVIWETVEQLTESESRGLTNLYLGWLADEDRWVVAHILLSRLRPDVVLANKQRFGPRYFNSLEVVIGSGGSMVVDGQQNMVSKWWNGGLDTDSR